MWDRWPWSSSSPRPSGIRKGLDRLAVSAACVVLAAGHGPAESKGADTLHLKFGWPPFLALRVERSFERRELRDDPEGVQTAQSIVSYVWRGLAKDGEYHIASEDFEVLKAEVPPSSRDRLLYAAHVLRVASAELPTLVVDAAAQPLRAQELPGFRERVAARYAAIPGLDADLNLQHLIRVSMRNLERRGFGPWYFIAQIWHGRQVEIGKPWQVEQSTGGRDPERAFYTYLAERRVPCAGNGAPTCLRLVICWSVPARDAHSFAPPTSELVQRRIVPPTARIEQKGSVTLDTHPDTLVPARYVYTQRFTASWTDGGDQRIAGWSERTAYDYTEIPPD